jgi:ComF family protein
MRKAILVLKYKYAYGMGEVLADKAAERLVKSKILNGKDGSSLLPIPIHKRRKNTRGFNQTEIVGKLIAEKMLWQYRGKMLIKTRYTVPQTGLERTIRLRNQRNSYKVIGLNEIDKKQTVFLFDDICTTGATIKEVDKTLKRKGFTNVWGLTIAKT